MTEDKKVFVVPTKTIPQGITAIINYIPEKTPEENLETMKEEMCQSQDRTGDLRSAGYPH